MIPYRTHLFFSDPLTKHPLIFYTFYADTGTDTDTGWKLSAYRPRIQYITYRNRIDVVFSLFIGIQAVQLVFCLTQPVTTSFICTSGISLR